MTVNGECLHFLVVVFLTLMYMLIVFPYRPRMFLFFFKFSSLFCSDILELTISIAVILLMFSVFYEDIVNDTVFTLINLINILNMGVRSFDIVH